MFAFSLLLAGCNHGRVTGEASPWLGGQPPPATAPPVDVIPKPATAPGTATKPPAAAPAAPRRARAPDAGVLPLDPELDRIEPSPLLRPVAPETRPVRVGLLLPLSGPSAAIGRALLDAAQLALFDLGDERLEIVPRDTHGRPEGAREAMQAALAAGAEVILGPLFSASVAAAAPAARLRGINLIAFSTDRSVAGNGVFLIGYLPEQHVERVVGFARARGLGRFAALAPDTLYGAAMVNALRRSVARHGGAVTQVEFYSGQSHNAHAQVKRLASYGGRRAALKAERRRLAGRNDDESRAALRRLEVLDTLGRVDFDAVLLADGGDGLRAVAPLLPYYDIDPAKVRFLGTGFWNEPTIGKEPALVGGWFAAPPPEILAAFEKRFTSVYGRTPPRIASLAYDAMALAAVLAGEEGGADFSVQALTDASGFAGTGGIFRFHPNGVVERGLAVLEVRPDGFKVVGEAPKTFQRLGF